MSQKQLLCDFRAKIVFFFASIDCLGVKLFGKYGVHFFFEPLTQFWGLFMKNTPFLCLFGTVNINKAFIPDKKFF